MSTVEWGGLPVTRSVEFSLSIPAETLPLAHWRLPHNQDGERTMRIELPAGQTWRAVWPALRRGQAVDFEMEGRPPIGRRYVFRGRVLYRRLGRLVVVGHVASDAS